MRAILSMLKRCAPTVGLRPARGRALAPALGGGSGATRFANEPGRLFSVCCLLMLAACAQQKTAENEPDCFPLSAGYPPPDTSGYSICAVTIWGSRGDEFRQLEPSAANGKQAFIFAENVSYSSPKINQNEFRGLVTTEAVNRSLCRQSGLFNHCRASHRYTTFAGSEATVELIKVRDGIECRSVNHYRSIGMAFFTMCAEAKTNVFEGLNLRKLANEALRRAA